MLKRLVQLGIFGMCLVLFVACESQNGTANPPAQDATTSNETTNEETNAPADAAPVEEAKSETIEAFWAAFVDAVKSKDNAKILSLSSADHVNVDVFMNDATVERLTSSSVADMTSSTMEMPIEATEVYELHLNYAFDMDGNVLPEDHQEEDFLDSSEMFYFGKVDGEYRWVTYIAAG